MMEDLLIVVSESLLKKFNKIIVHCYYKCKLI